MEESPELFWDTTYAIALALIDEYPERKPDTVGLDELFSLVESLPNFKDDPALVTERILMDIQISWFEEAT